ncbi:MAG: bifunctional alpha,alpha-trehalose-phosphate synthase (UDP-forming)/trehalose-phosphatase, partial [Spirochaetes bacterium]|nr:bifunctional alpha,alpha-trehalose-phosphate synthase (UDP-forming)/trehalose-phosphatase [Spirochaetota bacterium]
VHDYQLMLLPQMIRNKFPNAKIGYFHHIPFPSFEIFRLLPWSSEIISGLLGSDLIGFHTFSYVRHFLSSSQRILGYENTFGKIMVGDRLVKIDSFPMGIDYDKYHNSYQLPEVKKQIAEIKKNTGDKKIILSIDRLDYTKGLVERLEAYDYFLKNNPQYHEKIVLIMIAVPSRTQIETYHDLKSNIDELVGRINGKYSSISWDPIWYMFRSVPFEQLTAMYNVADIALLTPLRDGMNLIAKEYLAAKVNNKGNLILSEMAGVAEELGEAIIVNPNNKDQIADALQEALILSIEEQSERITAMQHRLKRNNVFKWANDFVEALSNIDRSVIKDKSKLLTDPIKEQIFSAYKKSKKRILFLNYDGTLVSITKPRSKAVPDKEIMGILKNLVKDTKNDVVIFSAREKEIMEYWFHDLDVTLIAEHGVWIKDHKSPWKTITNLDNKWKAEIIPILEAYVDRTPGSFIVEKDYSLSWHYRMTDQDFASVRINELIDTLLTRVANLDLGIFEGHKYLEIKSLEINKSRAAAYIMADPESADFIVALGDDSSDDELFKILPENAFTIKVGTSITAAKYSLVSHVEVRKLLKEVSST